MTLAKFDSNSLTIKLPVKVGDCVFIVGRNDTPDDNSIKVTKGIISRLSLVQCEEDNDFLITGEITIKSYDWFYNDGRYTDNTLFFGQGKYRFGETVFKTFDEAHKVKLKMLKK